MNLPQTADTLSLDPRAERLFEMGSFEWNIQTNDVTWSDGLFRIYGLEPQQFGATLEAFLERVVPEDRAHVQSTIQKAIETCGSFSCIERIHHTSGEIRYLESKGEILTDGNGQPTKLVGLCRDVTETKKLESQLQASQKMEAIGRLAAGVAHDFNNLLTVIKINVEFLLSGSDNEVNPKFASAIQDAATRASNLSSQLLMFGQKGNQNPQVISLNDHISKSQHLLSSLLGDRVSLNLNLGDDMLNIKVDQSHLDQVLVNLTVNAHEAMPNGGTFTVSTMVEQISDHTLEANELSAGTYVALVVSDTGKGMTSQECEKAFEPFYSDKPMGTGLGLAVVYGVVKDCNAMIQLSSKPDVGTTFRILFPAACQESEDPLNAEKVSCNKKGVERILIVDDEPSIRTAVQYALEQNGYGVLSAENGKEAIDLVRSVNGEIDLLLTDVVMPGMTGPEMSEVVVKEYPDVPVLYVSGYNETLTEVVTQQQLLVKPFSIKQLLERIQAVLN